MTSVSRPALPDSQNPVPSARKDDTANPFVSVVVPTRNRPGTVTETVRKVLANDGDFEVIVVDQSDDDSTRSALAVFEGQGVRYVRTATRGVAAGRNAGIRHACAEIVGLLDDDCTVPPTWVRELVAAFRADGRVGVVFGNLQAAAHDPTVGFVGGYVRGKPSLARHLWEQDRADGVAACMGLRRSVWERLRGFDEMLGAGAPLKSASEGDFTLRALAAGHSVYDTPRWEAVHHGFRGRDEGPVMIHRYWYGTGAMVAKPLKLGERGAWRLLLRLGWRWAFGRSAVSASMGGSPRRWLRLSAFVQGFAAGLFTPLDRSTGHYVRDRREAGAGALGLPTRIVAAGGRLPVVGRQRRRDG